MSSMRSASSRTRISSVSSVTSRCSIEVEQAAGRGDEDVDAAARAPRPAAPWPTPPKMTVRRQRAGGGRRSRSSRRSALASSRVGRQDEARGGPCGRRRARSRGEALQDRQRERGGLAGAGLGDAEQVAAREHEGNRLRLDRRGRLVVLGGQRLQKGSGEAEVGKRGHVVSFIGCGVRPDAIAHERTLRPRWPWGTPRVIWDVLKEIEGVEPWLEAGRILKDPITQPDCSVSRCDGEVYGPSQLRSQAGSEFLL